jgi:hypothetical protein
MNQSIKMITCFLAAAIIFSVFSIAALASAPAVPTNLTAALDEPDRCIGCQHYKL